MKYPVRIGTGKHFLEEDQIVKILTFMDYMVSVQLFSSALGSQKQPEKMSK
jgi:hypothetical protein